jgi:hypothetical protein
MVLCAANAVAVKLHLLEKGIDEFLARDAGGDGWVYPHALVAHFHRHWRTPDPASILDLYAESLQSRHAQRWWKRDQYTPRETMEMLIRADAELATLAWKDLANEAAALDGRIDRFGYYCQDILDGLRRRDIRVVDTWHHQDAGILSLYLAGMYPDKYALYPGLAAFQAFCRKVESPSIPQVDDLPRYMKVTAIVFTYLQKHPDYTALAARRSESRDGDVFMERQTAFEVISVMGGRPLSAY